MTKITKARGLAVVVAIMVALSFAAGGAVAAVSWDTETTTTTTTSDVSGSSNTITWRYGSNDTYSVYVETDGFTGNKSDLVMELQPAASGVNTTLYSNDSVATENSANGHYSFNMTGDETGDLPRPENGGTYDLKLINKSDGSVVLSTEVTLDNSGKTNTTTVVWVTGEGYTSTEMLADTVSLKNTGGGFFSLSTLSMGLLGNSSENETVDVAKWSAIATIDGTNTTTEVHLSNSSAADVYDSAASDDDKGEWIDGATLFVNNVPRKIYKGSAPDDVDANSTYAVYHSSTDVVEIHHGSDLEGVSTITMRGAGGQGYAWGTLISNFGFGGVWNQQLPDVKSPLALLPSISLASPVAA